MRLAVETIRAGRGDARTWFALVAILAFFLYSFWASSPRAREAVPHLKPPVCLLKFSTGIPCPFCGITTGTYRMLNGEVGRAWRANILSPAAAALLGIVAAYLLVFWVLAGRRLRVEAPFPRSRTLWYLAAAAIGASWAVNLWRA